MANYRVHWEIDVEDVDTPAAAARQALNSILRPGSIAHVFDVDDHEGNRTTVDLDEADEKVLKATRRIRVAPGDEADLVGASRKDRIQHGEGNTPMTLTAPDTTAPTRAHFADPEARIMALESPAHCPVLPTLRFRAIAASPDGSHHLVISFDRPASPPVVFHLGPDRDTIVRRGLIVIAGLRAHGDLTWDPDGLTIAAAILSWFGDCWVVLHEELGKDLP